MLKSYSGWMITLPSPPLFPVSSNKYNNSPSVNTSFPINGALRVLGSGPVLSTRCRARRRVRYNDEDEEEEEYGHNADIAMLELYSQTARDEVLLVRALVDNQEVEVLIFKGFSSCLSYKTSPDPSRSVLPERAVIKSIDKIKGPFDPSNIEYLEKGLAWEIFKSRLDPN
ncbi:uncharacterized protein LOC130791963 [Actinidia eriantha]|uniref:uncharacterized protein LOC130791963 n=1 Tax=Actinidia eriantha TaxID=165200 RepID=UPI00258D4363|nr:uncharacterized protein LOC130791963 [Actinidia eriantha]